jgi:hypothetical protein
MSAFNASTKIKRAVSDPLSDHKLPHPKSLSWGAIHTSTAVSGTKGEHCDLVHGDQWNEVKGNHNENILQNQTIKVVGKHKETLVESCYQNIIGPHIVQNNSVRNETRLDKFSLVYGDNTITQDSSGDQNVKPFDYSCTWVLSFEADTSKLETVGIHGELVDFHAELVPIHVEMMALHAENTATHFQHDDWCNQDVEMEDTLKQINNRIDAVNTVALGSRTELDALSSHVHMVVGYDHLFTEFNGTENHLGPENHTGPAIFEAITSPMIFP